jgi:hypothetical protein
MNSRIRGCVIKVSDSSNGKKGFVSGCDFFLRKLEEALQMWMQDDAHRNSCQFVVRQKAISLRAL